MIYLRVVVVLLLSLSVKIGDDEVPPEPPLVIKEEDSTELICAIKTLYFEGRSEGTKGLQMIMNVLINRTKDKRFPNTICEVVAEKNAFSFYSPRMIKRKIPTFWYRHIKKIAVKSLEEDYKPLLPTKVLWFKNCGYSSEYFATRRMYTKVGNHCFYY